MKRKVLSFIMLALGLGFIIYYVVLKYNIERQIPLDALLIVAASVTAQTGLELLCLR